MFLPIGDDQEHDRAAFVTYALIAVNAIVFVVFCLPHPSAGVLRAAAFVPAHPRPTTLLSSMFLHSDILHLAGNMLFLWLFGRIVEERIGPVGFAVFYLASGLAASLLHAVTTAEPGIGTIGASGATSGAVGAALLFCPRANIKVFILWWGIYEIPAVVWIALWFAEQVFFSSRDYGNVAYYAHIGGFAAGAAMAWGFQLVQGLRARRGPPLEPKDSASLAEPRRPFAAVPGGEDPVFLDDSVDTYAVVTLEDAASQSARVAGAAAVSPARLERSHGVVARSVPRAEAERIRRALGDAGIASALVADVPANRPPTPEPTESVSWDDRTLRFRWGDQSVPVPWAAPFLFVAARAGAETFVDVFVSPKTAFRVRQGRVSITRVDVRNRSEESTDLAGLARDIALARPSAVNEGIRRLSEGTDLGWLAFQGAAEYDDYLFWAYNLALSRSTAAEG